MVLKHQCIAANNSMSVYDSTISADFDTLTTMQSVQRADGRPAWHTIRK